MTTAVPALAASITPTGYRHDPTARLRPTHWNRISDDKVLEMWSQLTAHFWPRETVPLSSDDQEWQALAPHERTLTMRALTGLAMLDTVQAAVGEICQIEGARTKHEEAVYFMQSVHARPHPSVFSTLTRTREVDEPYQWAVSNDLLQQRCKKVLQYYYGPDPPKRKVFSTLPYSLQLYAGVYLPLHLSVRAFLTNTADMIRLILGDEAVHGYYSGYKYERGLEAHSGRRDKMQDFMCCLLGEPHESLRRMEDVAVFVRYNASKDVMNLGYPARFNGDETAVRPESLAALAPSADENHGLFSRSGSSYVIGKAEHTSDDDWDF